MIISADLPPLIFDPAAGLCSSSAVGKIYWHRHVDCVTCFVARWPVACTPLVAVLGTASIPAVILFFRGTPEDALQPRFQLRFWCEAREEALSKMSPAVAAAGIVAVQSAELRDLLI